MGNSVVQQKLPVTVYYKYKKQAQAAYGGAGKQALEVPSGLSGLPAHAYGRQ